LDVEFNAIQTAVESKADLNSPTFTGTPAAPTAASGTSSTQLATTAFVSAAASLALPAGVYFPWAGSTAPSGYLLCNGQAVSRTTYAALFAAVGTAWGVGDGSTTFNVPDMRDRMPIGAGNLYSVAASGGSKDAIVVAHTHTGTTATNGDHAHTAQQQGITNTAGAGPWSADGDDVTSSGSTSTNGAHNHTFTTDSTGASGTNANLPPYRASHFIIKT
jgi:microcystin-dependent protein